MEKNNSTSAVDHTIDQIDDINRTTPSIIESIATATEKENPVQHGEKVLEPILSEEEKKKIEKKEARARILTFIGLQLSLFLAALDGTIVSTTLPHIGSDFNQMSIVAWVATAYILTFDAFQPLFSKFSDIFGRKVIVLFGLVVFLIGSALCGAAQSMIMLIVSRAIAGIGGAGIFSMVFVIISDLVPLEKRGSYQGIINSVFALSSVFGPLIGGSFSDHVTWRWNFYINLPIGAVALAILIVFLRIPTPKDKLSEKLKRVDYTGTVIVLAFATLFLLALNFGGQTFPWKSAAVIAPLVISFAMVGLLVLVESKFAKEPLLPPRLFKNRSVVSVLLTNWFFGIAFFSVVYYLPIYFQVVRQDTATWSGIRLIPMQMVLCTLSTITGILISKTGYYKIFINVGVALLTLSVGLISLFDRTTSFSYIYGITVIGGAGLGFIFSTAIIALQASVEPKDIAVVTGLGNFARILGGALGIAISSAVLNSSLTQDLPQVIPYEEAIKVIESSEYVYHGLDPKYLDVTLNVYVNALTLLWHVLTPMCGLAFISSLFIQHNPILRNKIKEIKAAKAAALEKNATKEEEVFNHSEVIVDIPKTVDGEVEATKTHKN